MSIEIPDEAYWEASRAVRYGGRLSAGEKAMIQAAAPAILESRVEAVADLMPHFQRRRALAEARKALGLPDTGGER